MKALKNAPKNIGVLNTKDYQYYTAQFNAFND